MSARKTYARPGRTEVTVREAAALMGCDPSTAWRRLRAHAVKKLHRGRIQCVVLLARVREAAVPVTHETHESSGDIQEIRAQIAVLESAQIRLARSLAKVAQKCGVEL